MFSSALKSFTSNITSHYTLAPQPSSTSGPWKIYDAKRKSTGKAASVFVFDKKTLEPHSAAGGIGGRTSSVSLRKAQEEVLERLKKEASSLARLRHPSILELAEPVEETRNGGLMFATEPVTASLGSLLAEKDEQRQSGGTGQKRSRFVVEEADGTNQSRELEIDELEIQKGLLQLAKGLEFLHESAGLVHANITPEAVLVNAKGDWKISGFSFCGPHETSTAATSLTAISLSEVLNHDSRLPRSVQMNLDYTSPDFVLDNSLTPSADMFSLGLLIIALYNSPHASPLSAADSLSSYKRLFSSSSSVPTQNNNFLVPSSHPLPPKLASDLLPRLITRRPAQRLSAKEFQDASYFDNILVSTIRFLDALPAKSANEKAQFMRGLPRIMPQFPKSVLEKKVLPALLEEMKDKDLLAPIIADLFAAVKIMPNGKKAFTEQIVPRLREVFVTLKGGERDTSKEAGLMILLENMQTAAENCAGKEFREDILPIILLALESPTHAIVDAALGTLPFVLPALDFSTIKNELFPVIAGVFAKTSSLNIKIKGLEAFYILCGGTEAEGSSAGDTMNGFGTGSKKPSSASSSAILDKFTVQEKIVPLLKGIKTKEPGVMMAALRVFRQVGEVADSDFLAMEALPVLWSMSLGPLLNLQQFQSFMELIKKLGSRIEKEQTKKLQELRSGDSSGAGAGGRNPGGKNSMGVNGGANGEEADFESLVSGRKAGANSTENDFMNGWAGSASSSRPTTASSRTQSSQNTSDNPMSFSWQTPAIGSKSTTSQPMSSMSAALRPQAPTARAITPDQPLSGFAALTPSSNQYSQPLQPSQFSSATIPMRPSSQHQQQSNQYSQPLQPSQFSSATIPMRPSSQHQQQSFSPNASAGTNIDWSAASKNVTANPWSSSTVTGSFQQQPANGLAFGAMARQAQVNTNSFTLSPPPTSPQTVGQLSSPPLQPLPPSGVGAAPQNNAASGSGEQKSGLARYESLL